MNNSFDSRAISVDSIYENEILCAKVNSSKHKKCKNQFSQIVEEDESAFENSSEIKLTGLARKNN